MSVDGSDGSAGPQAGDDGAVPAHVVAAAHAEASAMGAGESKPAWVDKWV